MKVLILGATGFIGFPAAQALVRAGHTVYGLARTPAKAKLLAVEEVIPIIGDVDSDAWIHLIPTLDVLIVAVMVDPKVLLSIFEKTVKAAQEARPAGAPLLSYIQTSGTWVHGDNRTDVVTDTTPITAPVAIVSWLPELEQRVVRSTAVNGIVIRPSLVYGRSASNFAPLFRAASQGRVVWPGTPGGRYALVHTDDVADLYVRTAEKALLVGGQIFDASNPTTESVNELLQKLVEVSGATGQYEYTKPANLLEEAISSTALVRPYLANALLGWSVKKQSLTEGLESYYAAWLASTNI
ncbi:hypothetical protein FB451DRAFT_1344325 [Mycena latifolia]|nr:hypothetical protein FB451DRAFT_1344325 [Mycena latifolia]